MRHRRRIAPHIGSGGALAILLACAVPARAGSTEAHAVLGLGGVKTEWRGDIGAASFLKLGLRPTPWIALCFLGRLGYGTVDQRMLTFVSIGAQVWPLGSVGGVEPYARFFLAHQHEETLSVVRSDPFGALFGIGDGIRHRGGLEGALGLDIPIHAEDGFEVFASIEGSTVWFYDPRGPTWYVSGSGGLGFNYDL